MYKVIKFFTDLQDGEHPYNVGDVYPRAGVDVTDNRIAELLGSENRQHTPLIRLVGDEPKNDPKKAPAKRTRKTAEK